LNGGYVAQGGDPIKLKDAISRRIKLLCKERNLNPSSLAYLCGIDRSTVYSILGDKSKSPEVATIKKICDGLEITLGEFFCSPEFDGLEQEIK
jgi:transcriptional regulator with XRE-family HTH domain